MMHDKTILAILETIEHPLLHTNAQQMQVDARVACTHNTLDLTLTAGFPCQLLEFGYKPLLVSALTTAFPNHQVNVHLQQFIKAHKTQLPGKGLRGVKNTIAVASGKGGVGKSTVTVNLATALAQLGAKVGILDADIYGPSIPTMLGQHDGVQTHGDYYLPVTAHGIQAMSIGYLTELNQTLIWRGPMLAKSLIQMLNITLWDDLDYLFIDLPPGTGDIQLTLVQKIPLTAALVVTTPQHVATLDAHKAITMFSKTGIDVLGVVENMSTHQCSHCGHEESIFGTGGADALCTTHNSVLLGQLPLHPLIRQSCDAGFPVGAQPDNPLLPPFLRTAFMTSLALAKKPINYADKFPPVVVE